jgi:uncharacterized protein (TIGR02145 family)
MRPSLLLLPLLALFWLAAPLQAQYVSTWDPDADGDDVIGVNDLLALLGVFEEVDSDGDGIFDSQDDCVGIYDACGACNGTGVDADADGICDDLDPCVGALDECGVCNGPGPAVPVIDEIIYATDSVFLPPVGTWYVFSFAVDTLYTYECPVQGCTDTQASNFDPLAVIDDGSCSFGPSQCSGQSTVTFDGYTYALVGIGTQCWFKENLRSDNYRNGDAIPGDLSNSSWQNTTSGAQTLWANDAANLTTFGRLYNWYATQDSRGLCPTGFHVPSDGEWMILEMALGMTQEQAIQGQWRGTDEGSQLKSSPLDSPPWDGANSSGFSATAGGFRELNGNYLGLNENSNCWSSSPDGSLALYRYFSSGNPATNRNHNYRQYGFSVRCLRDAEIGSCFDPDNDGVCAEDEVSGCTDSTATNFNPEATEEDDSCEFPGPAQCGGQSTVTFDGYTYNLVGIGTQCWFKENLRSDNYRNGDVIPGDLSNSNWQSTSSGAQSLYDNNEANLSTYGRLYNWYATQDSRGLCPTGFHVPSDGDWILLETHLGGSSIAGLALKSSGSDVPPWDGLNTSGFSGLPGGNRSYIGGGYFDSLGSVGFWWSSSSSGDFVFSRNLETGNSSLDGDHHYRQDGFSVRCLKD